MHNPISSGVSHFAHSSVQAPVLPAHSVTLMTDVPLPMTSHFVWSGVVLPPQFPVVTFTVDAVTHVLTVSCLSAGPGGVYTYLYMPTSFFQLSLYLQLKVTKHHDVVKSLLLIHLQKGIWKFSLEIGCQLCHEQLCGINGLMRRVSCS